MELHVFVPADRVVDRAQWQAALQAAAIPIAFATTFDPAEVGGFCPMTILGKPSGCEIDLEDALSLIENYPLLDGQVDAAASVFTFRFSGDMAEAACACGAAAGLMLGFAALGYDPQEGTLAQDPVAMIAAMRECLGAARG